MTLSIYKNYYEYEFPTVSGDPDEELESFAQAVVFSLDYWLKIHTNPEAWATMWLMDCSPLEFLENNGGTIENGYFDFDLKDAILEKWIEDNGYLFTCCSKCGCIVEVGYEDEDHDPECQDENGEVDWIDVENEDLREWFSDIGMPSTIDDDQVFRAMTEEGFEVYQDAMTGIIDGIIEEIKEILENLNECQTGEDFLAQILLASHLCHVNGDVVKDYGDRFGLDYTTVEAVQQEGIEKMFGQEQIDAFVMDFEYISADILNSLEKD